jgi:hypothetical protein
MTAMIKLAGLVDVLYFLDVPDLVGDLSELPHDARVVLLIADLPRWADGLQLKLKEVLIVEPTAENPLPLDHSTCGS